MMLQLSNLKPEQKQLARRVVWGFAILAVLLTSYKVYESFQFHLVRSDPSSKSVASISPFLRLDFNRTLYKPSVQIASNGELFSSYAVSEKSISLKLKPPLKVNQTYTISIPSLTSTEGEKIDLKFTFTVKDIPFQKLSKEQQAAILTKDAERPASRNNYGWSGTETLIADGVSALQVEALKQGLFLHLQKTKQTPQNITLKNIVVTPFDPKGSTPIANATFTVSLDSKQTYDGKLEFKDLTVGRLYLYEPQSGQTVYDSGEIDPYKTPL